MARTKYPSAGKLKAFLAKNHITQERAGEAIGVTRITMWSWIKGESLPSDQARTDIETWTGGEVKASGWPPIKDRRGSPGAIKPFKSGENAA
jgi:DNA-binding XRE family transcriptional regulator